jgi:hypothetical protein
MLNRLADPADRQRQRRRDVQQRYRARVRDGRMTVSVEIDHTTIDWLVRTCWLPAREFHTRREIAAAVGRLLQDTARG